MYLTICICIYAVWENNFKNKYSVEKTHITAYTIALILFSSLPNRNMACSLSISVLKALAHDI